jgi:2-polyprenyl-3-methyl-5-hydroxy-6-metoxy-1,4-benzoquinol methylase
MPIDFHDQNNRTSYTTRQANQTWRETIRDIVDLNGKNVLDIGCGGGIYSKALVEMGASQVTGVDFSQEMLKGATVHCQEYEQITFVSRTASDTKLPSGQYDVILARALIHHINDPELFFSEAFRLLRSGGTIVVQDRTVEDCLLAGSQSHIRGYFFSSFPRLRDKEVKRRHSSEAVQRGLEEIEFQNIQEQKLWETRKVYASLEDLSKDLLARTGRSILHDLTDKELQHLVNYIQNQWQDDYDQTIIERDRWTVWSAKK